MATLKSSVSAFLVHNCFCKGDENCGKRLQEFHTDNGFVVLPTPREIEDKQPADLHVTYRYFFIVDMTGYQVRLSMKDGKPIPEEYGGGGTVSIKSDCDWADLTEFFPIGRTARVRLPCKEFVNRPTATQPHQETERNWIISYEGESSISLPSGKWDVKHIRMRREIPAMTMDEEILFSESLGAAVKRVILVKHGDEVLSQTTSELLKHSE
jgi:hypothetical protein